MGLERGGERNGVKERSKKWNARYMKVMERKIYIERLRKKWIKAGIDAYKYVSSISVLQTNQS